ncbi:MAG: hypothetical protein EZS28_000167 [Streblomastix strix]|uniref:Uncharacterized protein n=1 Tax=Streblomastix strix TaxID=222440 RepID=A0A5J4XCQ5_9EUKA|nr:MAG: hypothetical protein EZS28_000167 [Streblomastix strix]
MNSFDSYQSQFAETQAVAPCMDNFSPTQRDQEEWGHVESFCRAIMSVALIAPIIHIGNDKLMTVPVDDY